MLKEYRLRKEMSQWELEEKTGLDRKTIFRIEHDQNIPHIDTFAKLVKELDMTNEEIIKELFNSIKEDK